MKDLITKFNIRVYGILRSEDRQSVLLSDEFKFGLAFTKFPGGGLEFGEGVIDALKREFQEELAIQVTDASLFYVNEAFQASAFGKDEQLLAIYYLVDRYKGVLPPVTEKRFDFDRVEDQQAFRWFPIDRLTENDVNFPIDKLILSKLKNLINS
jgi:ADP-ribose pyrophosphatase YjhB (NUDIX family)